MICSLTNKSTVPLLVDLTNDTSRTLMPGQKWNYDDRWCRPTDVTWELVELGLLEDKDEEDFYNWDRLSYSYCKKTQTHNWALEGF